MKKKKKNHTAKLLLCVFFLGCSAFFVWNILKEGVTTYTLQVDINEAKAQLEALQKENGLLVDEKEKLQLENNELVIEDIECNCAKEITKKISKNNKRIKEIENIEETKPTKE